jgi:hypothetical protein
MTVAALYVERGGPYFAMPDVDPWDRERDARQYARSRLWRALRLPYPAEFANKLNVRAAWTCDSSLAHGGGSRSNLPIASVSSTGVHHVSRSISGSGGGTSDSPGRRLEVDALAWDRDQLAERIQLGEPARARRRCRPGRRRRSLITASASDHLDPSTGFQRAARRLKATWPGTCGRVQGGDGIVSQVSPARSR